MAWHLGTPLDTQAVRQVLGWPEQVFLHSFELFRHISKFARWIIIGFPLLKALRIALMSAGAAIAAIIAIGVAFPNYSRGIRMRANEVQIQVY